jgi:outer membrane lipoprotein-sorting protein
MRRLVCLAAVLAVAACGTARADDQADLRKVIDKAIKATGGEEKLAKYKAESFKMKGKFYGMGDEGIEYTGEWQVQPPDKFRVQVDGEVGGQKVNFFTQVVNGNKVWRKGFNEETQEVTDKDDLTEIKEQFNAREVESLLPLVKGKEYQLASLGDVKVNDKPAVGIRVSRKGFRDVNLFFDKDKGLLVKVETIVKDQMTGGKEQTQEETLSDFKEVNGITHPMKLAINRDGKKYVDGEITEIEFKEKLDDAVFAKP